jgi:hypothetical protein
MALRQLRKRLLRLIPNRRNFHRRRGWTIQHRQPVKRRPRLQSLSSKRSGVRAVISAVSAARMEATDLADVAKRKWLKVRPMILLRPQVQMARASRNRPVAARIAAMDGATAQRNVPTTPAITVTVGRKEGSGVCVMSAVRPR